MFERFDFILRTITSSILAVGLVAAAAYQVLVQHIYQSPIVAMANLIVGVFFGAHVYANSRNAQSEAKIERDAKATAASEAADVARELAKHPDATPPEPPARV